MRIVPRPFCDFVTSCHKGSCYCILSKTSLNKPLATAYYMKDELRRFWDQPGKTFATLFLDGWIRRSNASGIRVLQQMAKTLAAHRTGLLAYYDVMISSGPMEGTNNKI
jgi:transposase